MNLLQIHEPGQSPDPHADEVAIGIDLGTTHSVVAFASEGNATVLHDICGSTLVPSVVQYGAGGAVVGRNAVSALARGEKNIVKSIKRLMGRGLADARGLSTPYELDETAGEGTVRLKVGEAVRTPVEISADILRHLRKLAEEAMGRPAPKAVITVPAYFDDAARTATRDAAKLAGLEVLRLINEPTAAALAYGLDNASEGIYAVYDLGGGTFDISILKMEKGVFQVLATGGDVALGGDDFDAAIAERILLNNNLKKAELPHEVYQQILHKARAVKECLTDKEKVKEKWDVNGKSINCSLTRAELEALMLPEIARSMAICAQVLADAELAAADVKGVVLAGGSTRIPLVRREVEAFFGRAPLTNVNPDEVVAVGAALQAEGLTRGSDNLLLDVVPLSLGLETMGGLVEKLIYRNTPIPVSVAQEFTTYKDGQNGMVIHVVQGEREMVDQCRSLARFELAGIPPMVAGMARVKVAFTVDADGLLSVSAEEMTTGTKQIIAVKPSYGLSPEEMENMLLASMENAKSDIIVRLLAEVRMEAERMVLELQSAIKSDAALLAGGEKELFYARIAALLAACKSEDRDEIDHEMQALGKASLEFAERRMNKAIQKALQGVNVDDYAGT